jgi:ClpP class serine protease
MESPQRKKFKTSQDWNDFIGTRQSLNGQELFVLRKACYEDIEAYRKRPLLIYATRFLDSLPQGAPNFIDLSDVDGFTDLVNSVKGSKSVDVLLHSPGGRPDATERLVTILRSNFEEIHFLIPHSAYSAATMLALSGDSIVLHKSATLGPIDPQINGIPARSIKRGFEKAKERIKVEGPESLPAYIPLIEKYSLDLLEQCEDSEKLSKELVTNWLKTYMFKNKKGMHKQIKEVVDYFSDYDKHLLHARPLSLEKLKSFKLKIEVADDTLQELLWEAYILLNGFFTVSPFVKLYETSHGVSWGKQLQQVFIAPQPQPQGNTP